MSSQKFKSDYREEYYTENRKFLFKYSLSEIENFLYPIKYQNNHLYLHIKLIC